MLKHIKRAFGATVLAATALTAMAQPLPYPNNFKLQNINAGDATIHVA